MVASIKFSAAAVAAFFASTAAARALPLPEAFAIAMAAPEEASYQCHSDCGNAILEARNCGDDTDCYCGEDTKFQELMTPCYACGSSLWSDYGKYLTPYLETCNMRTTPDSAESSAASATATAAQTTEAPATSAVPETFKAPASSTAAQVSEAPATSEPAVFSADAETSVASVKSSASAAASSVAAEVSSTPSAVSSNSAAFSSNSAASSSASSKPVASSSLNSSAPAQASSSQYAVEQSNNGNKVMVGAAAFVGAVALLI